MRFNYEGFTYYPDLLLKNAAFTTTHTYSEQFRLIQQILIEGLLYTMLQVLLLYQLLLLFQRHGLIGILSIQGTPGCLGSKS